MIQILRATVVIATRDRPEELRLCLESVRRSVTAADEIIVVDSASADPIPTREVAAAAGARLIRSPRAGSARARNLGIRHSRGEILAFTDDDARVDPAWLGAIVDTLSDHGVGAVVGPVFEIGSHPPALLFDFDGFNAATDVVSFNRARPGWFDRLRFGAIGSGANLAARRDVLERYGFFRESLGQGAPIGGDENFFLFSIVEGGETVFNQPAARVYHPPQSLARQEQLMSSSVAYLLYLALSRPQILPPLTKSVVSRLLIRKTKSGRGKQASRLDLLKSLLSAPRLLAAAWRIDRSG